MFPDQTYFTGEQATWALIETLGARGLDPYLYDLEAVKREGMRYIPDLDAFTFREPGIFWEVVDAHRVEGPSEEDNTASSFLVWVDSHRDKGPASAVAGEVSKSLPMSANKENRT